eukprot:scaffold214588_cov42-Prasinocladus_malaysianus.AAC.1
MSSGTPSKVNFDVTASRVGTISGFPAELEETVFVAVSWTWPRSSRARSSVAGVHAAASSLVAPVS